MFDFIQRVRDALYGYRTILTAVATILGGLVAWSTGEKDLIGLIAVVGVSLEAIFLRLGMANDNEETAGDAAQAAFNGAAGAVEDYLVDRDMGLVDRDMGESNKKTPADCQTTGCQRINNAAETLKDGDGRPPPEIPAWETDDPSESAKPF